jgi:branched-subunit amino acid aminotransferase/4-amino-4-deoxychorismate lyase
MNKHLPIYEAILVRNKHAWNLDAHLKRLQNSAKEVGATLPIELKEKALKEIQTNEYQLDSYLRINIENNEASFLQETYSRPASPNRVITFKGTRPKPKAKIANLITSNLARQAASDAGAADAILVDEDEYALEGATSNIFILYKNELITSTKDALNGTTQSAVLDLAKARNISTSIRKIHISEILAADELFITSALKLILPITKVDDTTIDSGTIGLVTSTLSEDLNKLVNEN